jgi:hypothetical protein
MTQARQRPFRSPNRCHDRQFFYKYVTANLAKTILATRRLRGSSPLLFNDPFDVTQELRLDFDEAELGETLAEEFAKLIEEPDSLAVPRHPAVAALLAVLKTHSNDDLRRKVAENVRQGSSLPTTGQVQAFAALKQVWREIVPTLRILCLSDSKDVMPMWQHYADSYQGAVIEFECLDGLDSAFLAARPVIYQDGPPRIASRQIWARCMLGQTETTYRDLFTEYMYIKTTAWSYEREWRIVTKARPEESGLFTDFPFSPPELTGIYLGERCLDENQADILSLLTHGLGHVSAYRALADVTQSKFTFKRIR